MFIQEGNLIERPIQKIEKRFDPKSFSLNPVTGLRVSQGEIDGISIKWDSYDETTYYQIERALKTNEEMEWKIVGRTNNSVTSFKDQGNLVNNMVYVYRIKAFSINGFSSKYSEESIGWHLSYPMNLSASKAGSLTEIDLKWEGAQGAQGYRVMGSSKTQELDVTVYTNSYIHRPSTDKGEPWTYKVCSLNNKNEKSLLNSNSDIGFTIVEGAPERVMNLKASIREKDLKLTWDKPSNMSSSQRYVISRLNVNTREVSELENSLDISSTNLNLSISANSITYIDRSAKANNKYEYSIYSYLEKDGKKLYSSQTKAIGFILSSISKINLKRVNGNSIIESKELIGLSAKEISDLATKNIFYEYAVTNLKVAEYSSNKPLFNSPTTLSSEESLSDTIIPLSATNPYFSLNINNKGLISIDIVLREKGSSETWYKTFSFNADNLKDYDSFSTLKVSSNKFLDGFIGNEDGVMPTILNFPEIKGAEVYHIYRRVKDGGEFKHYATSEKNTYYDLDNKIGKEYEYSVRAMDKANRISSALTFKSGYGALTNKAYLKLVDKYAIHAWRYQGRSAIKTLVDKGGLGSLGSASENGLVSGSINYYAKASGFAGEITFRHSSFKDLPFMQTDSSYVMHANASQNGSYTGNLEVTGMYPGKIEFTKLKISAGEDEGVYLVYQNNQSTPVELPPISTTEIDSYEVTL